MVYRHAGQGRLTLNRDSLSGLAMDGKTAVVNAAGIDFSQPVTGAGNSPAGPPDAVW